MVSGAGGLGAAAGPLIGGVKKGKDVLLPLRLFRNKISNLGLGTQVMQWLILQGTFFIVSVYLQEVWKYNAIQTGLVLTECFLS